jgi:hypothetical protein
LECVTSGKVNFEECKKKVWQGCKDFDKDIIKKSTSAETMHNALKQ